MPTRTLPLILLALLSTHAPASTTNEPDPARQAELTYLLRHDCGACHGMRLKGGLGPALTPQRLAGRDRRALAQTILMGRPGTPMPPWRPFLSDADADWLAGLLQQGEPQ